MTIGKLTETQRSLALSLRDGFLTLKIPVLAGACDRLLEIPPWLPQEMTSVDIRTDLRQNQGMRIVQLIADKQGNLSYGLDDTGRVWGYVETRSKTEPYKASVVTARQWVLVDIAFNNQQVHGGSDEGQNKPSW